MDANFLDIIQKVVSDRGKNCVNNLAVFNSLLADYAKGKYMRERRNFIRELKTKSFDDLMKQYQPNAYPPQPQNSASPYPAPAPAPVNNNNGYDDDFDEDYDEEQEKMLKHLKKGFKALDAGNNEKAEKHFRKSLSIEPTGSACFGLACCFARTGDYSGAIDIFEDAKDLFEEEGDNMGIKNCNRAIRDMNTNIQRKEENMDRLINVGIDIFKALFE